MNNKYSIMKAPLDPSKRGFQRVWLYEHSAERAKKQAAARGTSLVAYLEKLIILDKVK
jgi:hypothetical protein